MKKYFSCVYVFLGIIIIGGLVFLWASQKESITFIEKENLEYNQNLFLEEWNCGIIEGITGENQYTDILKSGSICGSVEEFLTFECFRFKGNDQTAFVVAGKQKENGFSGSIWCVMEPGEYQMIEQNVTFTDTKVQYQEFDEKRYLFLNFLKEGRNCGRVFLCGDSMPEEILMAILGKKTVDSNGNIICMHLSEDSRSKMETNLYTGEKYYKREGYTEKPYTLRWYKDGTIREVQADLATQEELLARSYGAEIIQKVEEVYRNEEKQYIIRDNGEVNVNIAVEDGEDITFFYMTFQTENQVLLVDSGAGCYFLHMTNDTNWKKFLKDFIKKDFYIQDYLRNFIHTPFMEKIDLEEDVFWGDQTLVGKEFVPEGDLLERLSGFVFDYSENWDMLPEWTHDIVIGSEEEREFYLEVRLIGKTDSFWIYGTNNINNMILKRKDDTYLWIDGSYTSLYLVQPQFFEADFDQDGEMELLIQGQFGLHGSGVYVESLFLADRDFNGRWAVCELQKDWYISEMKKHYQTEYIDGWMNLRIDGELVGVPADTQGNKIYYYSGGSQIRYQIKEDGIYLYSGLMAYSEQNPLYGIFGGNGICMKLSYLGLGKWEVRDCSYYSVSLEQTAKYAAFAVEEVKEVKEIRYNPMLVRECATTERSSIPVKAVVLTKQGEERMIEMELFYKKSLDEQEGKFEAENVRYGT